MCCSIMINSLIKIGEDEKEIERVLWISKDIDVAFLINIFNTSWPHEVKLSELIVLINEKKAQIIINEVHYRLIVESELSEKDKSKRDKVFNAVMEFYKYIDEPNIFITNERNKFINEVIRKCGISRRTIEDYIKRYWKRGMNPNALLPDIYRCGGKINLK